MTGDIRQTRAVSIAVAVAGLAVVVGLAAGDRAGSSAGPDLGVQRERQAALVARLLTVRQAIEAYKLQHEQVPPSEGGLVVQLTTRTDAHGAPGTEHPPALDGWFPQNPISGDAGVRYVATTPAEPGGRQGWLYNYTTGELRANVAGHAPSGVAWFDL